MARSIKGEPVPMKLFVIALTISVVFLAGCGELSVNSALDRPPEGTAEPAARPQATATPAPAASSPASTRCGGSLEGCFSYNEMGEYLEAITPMVASFFETEFENVAAPRNIVYIARGQSARGSCGVSDSEAYEYCGANQTIYVGQDLLWTFYRQAGDAAPAIGLAHEWAHHLQNMLDLPAFGSRSQVAAINIENQADCISGAWAKYAKDQGWLEEDDDLRDAAGLLQAIGSREGPGRDHGTAAERLQAFELSYEGGIKACNSYFPRSPIA
jgi:hypothetical protein